LLTLQRLELRSLGRPSRSHITSGFVESVVGPHRNRQEAAVSAWCLPAVWSEQAPALFVAPFALFRPALIYLICSAEKINTAGRSESSRVGRAPNVRAVMPSLSKVETWSRWLVPAAAAASEATLFPVHIVICVLSLEHSDTGNE
jgi:hypothetical protein